MIKWYFGAVLLIAAFVGGILLSRQWYQPWQNKVTTESAVVLAQEISTVLKLVAVEGRFSEIYDYRDYWGWDVTPLRKKALLRVDAKVSVGFDLENLRVEVDESQRTIFVQKSSFPEILSIDHELKYYDISQGAFNAFSSADYNRLNQKAKNIIFQAAHKDGSLFIEAQNQFDEGLLGFKAGLNAMGWKLEVIPMDIKPEEFVGPEFFAIQTSLR